MAEGDVFRVFVSSTFGDFAEERELLRRRVWPALEALCRDAGAAFEAVDLRWGVPAGTGAGDTVRICLEEIARCQRLTPRPNFLVLLGDRYGWRPPPAQVPADELETLARAAPLLVERYRRDDNAVPPVYRLVPGPLPDDRLATLLRDAAGGAGAGEEQRRRYFLSATHLEIIRGLLAGGAAAAGSAFAYLRRIEGLPAAGPAAARFTDVDADGLDAEAAALRAELEREVRAALAGEPGHVHAYRASWSAGGLGEGHLEAFRRQVEHDLAGAIGAEIARLQAARADKLSVEIARHEAFRAERAQLVVGRHDALASAEAHVFPRGSRSSHPVIVSGPGGSGKSALMARLAERARRSRPHAVVVARFVAATPDSVSPRALVSGIVGELQSSFGVEAGDEPPREALAALLRRASAQRPVLLLVDAVDQLEPADSDLAGWLATPLPADVALIVSVADGAPLAALTRELRNAAVLTLRALDAASSSALLDAVLAREPARTLQPDQRRALMEAAAGGSS